MVTLIGPVTWHSISAASVGVVKSQINKTVLRANRKIALVGMTRAVSSRRTANFTFQLDLAIDLLDI
jgi:hypothetical protein